MTNEEVMQLMTDIGLHEGGMDDWVFDNAWVMFANAVASAEREACALLCYEQRKHWDALACADAIRAGTKPRGQA